eukprot:g17029.t1
MRVGQSREDGQVKETGMRLVGRRWGWELRLEERISGRKDGQVKEAGTRWAGFGMRWGRGNFGAYEVHIDTIGLQGSQVKHEVLFLQPLGGIIVALEEAQDGHVVQEVGGEVEVVRNWEVQLFVANR